MTTDHALTEEEGRKVAKVIDGVMLNDQYPCEDDWGRFTLLMFELHQKKYNLPDVNVERDFVPYCTRRFPKGVIEEMQVRTDCMFDLVYALHEKQRDYLPDMAAE